VPTPDRFAALEFSPTFFRSFASEDFSTADRNQFLKALILLDQNEKHPSLRVHALEGNLDGLWSASASSSLRMTFTRLDGGRKLMLTCSRHYDR
jgi:mRNA-degrading endonuclease YafQ of YafQ-DinJ toxin-antitoxin module